MQNIGACKLYQATLTSIAVSEFLSLMSSIIPILAYIKCVIDNIKDMYIY